MNEINMNTSHVARTLEMWERCERRAADAHHVARSRGSSSSDRSCTARERDEPGSHDLLDWQKT